MTELQGLVTTVYGPAANIPPKPSTVGLLGLTLFSLRIRCVAPSQPIPVAFNATLVVSWESGSLQIALSGTTAQIGGTVTTHQPVTIREGDDTTVDVELTYLSLDPTTLEIQLSPTQFPRGLSFNPVSVSMPSHHLQGAQGKPHLVTKRVKSVPLDITSQLLTSQLGKRTGYSQLSILAPSLSGFAPEPGVEIKFDIEPWPIDVKVSPTGPIVIVPGTPAQATLSITTKGNSTIFAIAEPAHLPAGITVEFLSSAVDGQVEIGQGTTLTPITIKAPFDPSSMSTRLVTITLSWKAHGGLSTGNIKIGVKVLPSVLIFSTGHIDASGLGVDVFGSAVWTLNSNGNYNFAGDARTGDKLEDKFIFAIASEYVQQTAQDDQNNNAVYGVVAYGTPSATWNVNYSDPLIVGLWAEFCSHGARGYLSAQGWGDLTLANIGAFFGASYFIYLGGLVAV
jgi:hypothetical protein